MNFDTGIIRKGRLNKNILVLFGHVKNIFLNNRNRDDLVQTLLAESSYIHDSGVVFGTANIGFTLMLVWSLQHAGLAAATSLAAYLNALLLLRGLRRSGAYRPQPGWGIFGLRVALATAAMTVLLWLGAGSLDVWLALGAGARVSRLAVWVLAGTASYGAALLVLRQIVWV